MTEIAYTLTAVNLFIAFLLYRRARRLRDEADALKSYKESIAAKVNEAMRSYERATEMHRRQIEVLEARNEALTTEFNKLLNKQSEPLIFSYRADMPQGYRLN